MSQVALYHGNCSDGLCSAYVWMLSFVKNRREKGEFDEFIDAFTFECFTVPVFHNMKEEAKQKLLERVKGNTITCLDYCPPEDLLEEMIKMVNLPITIIDHHISTMSYIEKYVAEDKVNLVFDLEKSGAGLTWKHYFPDVDPPLYVQYIEQNDLWKKDLPFVKEVTAYIQSYPVEYNTMVLFSNMSDLEFLNRAMIEGTTIKRANDTHYNMIVDAAKLYWMDVSDEENKERYKVYLVNCPWFLRNEPGNMLAQKPECDFAVLYSVGDDRVSLSFRGIENKGFDLSMIARKLGSGGHKLSSGCSLRLDKFKQIFTRYKE